MRIDPLRPKPAAASARRADRAGGFVPESPAEAGAAQAALPAASLAGLDALMAIQDEAFDPARRGRQIGRAGRSLDALDAVRLAFLGTGSLEEASASLTALEGALEPTGDPKLDAVLIEIETRRLVELAKIARERRLAAL